MIKHHLLKNYLLLVFLIATGQLFSQEAYFLTGSNFTKYAFNSSDGAMTTPLQSGVGSTYEMGYSIFLKNHNMSYSAGIALNEYNAMAGSPSNSYAWDTKYIGIQNALSYNYPVTNDLQLGVKLGVNLSTIIYGKQNINGAIHDLKNQAEFAGIVYSSFVGFQTNYKVNDLAYLSLGYALSKNLNLFNTTSDNLSFTTKQILFGIHFNINTK